MTKIIISLAVLIVVSTCPAKAGILKKTLEHSQATAKTLIVKPIKAVSKFAKEFAKDPIGHTWDTTKNTTKSAYRGMGKASEVVQPVTPLVNFASAVATSLISAKAAGVKF